MMPVMNTTLVWLFLIALCGAFIQTNIGFGFPLLAMVFLPLLFPFSTAVTLCQLIAIVSTTYLTIKYWEYIKWRTMIPLLLVSLATGIVVTFFSIDMAQGSLKMILGTALVGISVFTVWFSERIKIKPTIAAGASMGLVAGLGNGLFGIGGPQVAIYLLAGIEEKRAYLATIQCYFFISNISTIIVRASKGSVTWEHTPYVIAGWMGIGLGTYLGLKIFNRIPHSLVKKLVYAFIGLSGVWIVVLESMSR
jgi:uncharacterized protein